MIEAVIFDIHGTIVDSVNLHAKAWKVAFEKFGKEVSFEAIRRQIGKGTSQWLPVFFSKEELDEFGAELKTYRAKLFMQEYLPSVKGLPKVRELFERIKQDNKQITLASSAKGDELKTYKEVAQINDLIQDETSGQPKRSRRRTNIFEASLEQLGRIAPQRVIAIGSTPYNAEAAAKTNMGAIGLLCGGWTPEQLRRSGCIGIFRDPGDLLACYEDSPLAQ